MWWLKIRLKQTGLDAPYAAAGAAAASLPGLLPLGGRSEEDGQNNVNLETPPGRPDLLISFPATSPWQAASGPYWLLLLQSGLREQFFIIIFLIYIYIYCCETQLSFSRDCIAADSIWPLN